MRCRHGGGQCGACQAGTWSEDGTQSSFAEIVVKEEANVSAVVEALENEYKDAVVVVVEDASGREVIRVYGDEEVAEAIRRRGRCAVRGTGERVGH